MLRIQKQPVQYIKQQNAVQVNKQDNEVFNINLIPNCTNLYNTTFMPSDRPQTSRNSIEEQLSWVFLQICLMIGEFDEMRIVEKIARPIHREEKQRLIYEVNAKLQKLQKKLNFIRDKSSKFVKSKGQAVKISYQKENILVEEEIYPSRWKDGLRKVQVKLNNFYKERLQKFDRVNEILGERFVIKKIDSDAWLKECMKKMKGFCWCG